MRLSVLALLLVVFLAGTGGRTATVEAATLFLVTTTADTNDGVCNADCSLREAITLANGNGNAVEMDTINFAIPGTGPHVITPSSALPTISQPLKIDGTTESGTVCNYPGRTLKIQIAGSGAAANGIIGLDTSIVVLGLSLTGFSGSAITITGGSGHEFRCNHVGLGPGGEDVTGNSTGIRLTGSPGANVGGPGPADRNVVSDNGFGFVINDSSNLVINGNYIGTTVDGSSARENGYGIYGGGNSESSFLANVIVSSSAGIYLGRNQSGLVMESNIFNYASNGVTPIGSNSAAGIGIFVLDGQVSTGHIIGGTTPGLGNKIRAGDSGIYLAQEGSGSVSGVTIRGNQVKMESGRAITLSNSGFGAPTISNDPLDADSNGPNLLQNFPVVAAAAPGGAIQGTLHSAASTTFDIDFYASVSCLYRTGERYLGSAENVPTNGSGNATFSTAALGAFNAGEGITATATDENGNTSEMSACFTASAVDVATISPEGAVQGASDKLITITGSGFSASTKVLWNNVEQPTTFMNTTTIQFTATAEMIGDDPGGVTIRLSGEDEQFEFPIWRSSSDVNCNLNVGAGDALALMRLIAGIISSTECPPDANKSGGAANLADVVHIRRELADLSEPLKSENQVIVV